MVLNGSAGHLNLKNAKYRNKRIFLNHQLVIKLTLIILIIWIEMIILSVCNYNFGYWTGEVKDMFRMNSEKFFIFKPKLSFLMKNHKNVN